MWPLVFGAERRSVPMYDLLATIGGIFLVIAFCRCKGPSTSKSITIAVILILYIWDIGLNHSSFGEWASEGPRQYIFNSLHELVLVLFLHLKPCKETVIVMALALTAVIVNIIGFSLYATNHMSDGIISWTLMTLFYIQIIILFNKEIADGVYRGITTPVFIRSYCYNYLKITSKGYK